MLFLTFLHKITPNCKVRDYKTAPFRIITYSLLTHPPLGNIKSVQGIFQRVNDVYLVRRHGTALHNPAEVAVAHLHGAVAEAPGYHRVR